MGDVCTCERCGRIYEYDSRKGHTKRKCNSCMRNSDVAGFKRRVVEYLGGECVVCGYGRYIGALDVHHVDPSEKALSIAGNHNRRWEVIAAELDKCVLLCRNCHAELHAKMPEIVEGRRKPRKNASVQSLRMHDLCMAAGVGAEKGGVVRDVRSGAC